MDHKDFIASLSADQKRQLNARSDAAGLRHLAGHAGLILILGTLIALRVPYWPILLLPQGIALTFLFTLQHETTHKTPFANTALNEWVGRIVGALIVQPFTWFRYFHLAHHRFTNIPGKDPELATAKPDTWRSWICHVSGIPAWWASARRIAINAFGQPEENYLPPNARPSLRAEARWMLAIYLAAGLTFVASDVLLWIWLVPLLLGQPVLRLYLLAEHGRCAFVANMFENTRTTFTNRVVRFLAWNMPFHAEHHAMPSVPFHRLPNLHNETMEHLQVTERGYARFTRRYTAGFTQKF
jgi:fatty acid desaturase